VDASRLLCDPLAAVCLDCLSAGERRVLELDLARATEVQARLLPPSDLDGAGWRGRYVYRPHGAVGGDYVDVLEADGPSGELLVMVGDVAGKGVAAALVMAHLQAVVRATARSRLPLTEVFARANRLLFESTSTSAYATLVGARLGRDGSVELCTAGHAPPILVTPAGSLPITAGGLPLGLFPDAEFASRRLTVDPGESLLMFTDGLSESLDPSGRELGTEGVRLAVDGRGTASPAELVEAAVAAAAAHRGGGPAHDDLTVLAVTRELVPETAVSR
jgi:sigma-B regulation protein RsbU (phosphoserine phosphatase)